MSLKQKIDHKTVVTGIIGLGYVGLPLMHSISRSGLRVIGFDIDPHKIIKLNKGESYLDTVSSSIISGHRQSGLFEASWDFSRLKECDVVIICVPTPLDEHREPDLSYVTNTAEVIAQNLQKGQLVVLESTTYPGTIKDVIRPLMQEISGMQAGQDFYLAFSPEREDPGNPNFETATIPKVVGADSENELALSVLYYSLFLNKVVPVSSTATAEAVKITENIFRAVNIAMVNELKVIYAAMGIDVWEVIEAAKTKPFGYMPFYPGPGLGGHCIPIDPFYLTWKAREIEVPTRFIELAGEINTAMPRYVVEQTVKALNDRLGKALNGAKILILGIAYKKNVNDQRESPAFTVMEILKKQGAILSYFDPHIPEITATRRFKDFTGMKSVGDLEQAAGESDVVLLLTDHDKIDYEMIADKAKLIIDTRNVFAVRQLISDKILKA